MPVPLGPSRPSWRMPFAITPILLCIAAVIVVWQLRVTETAQRSERAKIVQTEQRLDAAPGPRPKLRARLTAQRAAEHRLNARGDWLTWTLGGLVLPAAGLVLFGGLRRREEDGGRARSDQRRLQALVQHSTDMI